MCDSTFPGSFIEDLVLSGSCFVAQVVLEFITQLRLAWALGLQMCASCLPQPASVNLAELAANSIGSYSGFLLYRSVSWEGSFIYSLEDFSFSNCPVPFTNSSHTSHAPSLTTTQREKAGVPNASPWQGLRHPLTPGSRSSDSHTGQTLASTKCHLGLWLGIEK